MSNVPKSEPTPRCIGKCMFSVAVREYGGEGIQEFYKCGSCGRKVPKRKEKK